MPAKTVARCQSCGAESPRWVGRCPSCGEWGTVVEEPVTRSGPAPARPAPDVVALDESAAACESRAPSGIDEVDRVLGGGLVRGSVVLLAGEPGVGKSTLTLQVSLALAQREDVLLVCGEESPQQIAARAARLGVPRSRVRTLADSSLPAVLAALQGISGTVVVDSVQTLYDPDIASAPGSVAQVRECGARLARVARENDLTVVLVGHVTKDGSIAGPRVLEHLVDVVLTFDGDRQGGLRVLRALKNRFGSTHDAGFFEMTGEGLVAIRDASRYLLQDRCPGEPGSVLAAAVEGRRPVVIEVQALVAGEDIASPRRTALGVDPARLPLLVAVLQRRLGIQLGHRDVYVSAVGGLRIDEPATDLPAALAILSSCTGFALPEHLVAFGEIGLAGEVRQVGASDRRLAEARAVGCSVAVVPHGMRARADGIEILRVRHLRDAHKLVSN